MSSFVDVPRSSQRFVMNLRILICGVAGGWLGALALSLPLFLALPADYSPTWPWASSPVHYVLDSVLSSAAGPMYYSLGSVLAAAAGFGAGYVAARWGWAESFRDRVRMGALGGLLAGMVAYPLIGAATAGVVGTGPIFQAVSQPDRGNAEKATLDVETRRLIAETVARVGWFPYLTFWAMILAGSALGALGGWTYARRGGGPWGETRPMIAVTPLDALIAILITFAIALLMCIQSAPVLGERWELLANTHNFQISWPAGGTRNWPIGMTLLVLTLATWYCGRWCHAHWGHAVEGVRRTARKTAGTMAAVPLVTLMIILINIRPDLTFNLVFLCGAIAWVGAAIFWVVRIWLVSGPADSLPLPSLEDRLLINAAFLSALMPSIVMATGLSSQLTLVLGLGRGTGNELPLSVDGSIASIYIAHFLFCCYMTAAWMVLAVIHATTVMGGQALFGGTPETSRKEQELPKVEEPRTEPVA